MATAASPIVFRDEGWLQSVPLTQDTVLDYFALSPFYDTHSINEMARQGVQEPGGLSSDFGVEFGLRLTGSEGAGLFVIEKRRRHGQLHTDMVVTDLYYCLYGSIYAAPDLETVLRARLQQSSAHISRALEVLLREERERWQHGRPEAVGSGAGAGQEAASTAAGGGVAVSLQAREKEREEATAAYIGSRVWAAAALQ